MRGLIISSFAFSLLTGCGDNRTPTNADSVDTLNASDAYASVEADPAAQPSIVHTGIKARLLSGDLSVCADQPMLADMLWTQFRPSNVPGSLAPADEIQRAIEEIAPTAANATTLIAHNENTHEMTCEALVYMLNIPVMVRYTLRPDLQSENYVYEVATEPNLESAWIGVAFRSLEASFPSPSRSSAPARVAIPSDPEAIDAVVPENQDSE